MYIFKTMIVESSEYMCYVPNLDYEHFELIILAFSYFIILIPLVF